MSLVGPFLEGLENAPDLHPALLNALLKWSYEGTHVMRIPSAAETAKIGLPPPGLRSGPAALAWQKKAYASGASNAQTLRYTPHGPRLYQGQIVSCAVDVWVKGFNPRIAWKDQPAEVKGQFKTGAQFMQREGLRPGAFWKPTLKMPNGDQVHYEVPGWQQLPFVEVEP